jgi:hypothetical protein
MILILVFGKSVGRGVGHLLSYRKSTEALGNLNELDRLNKLNGWKRNGRTISKPICPVWSCAKERRNGTDGKNRRNRTNRGEPLTRPRRRTRTRTNLDGGVRAPGLKIRNEEGLDASAPLLAQAKELSFE